MMLIKAHNLKGFLMMEWEKKQCVLPMEAILELMELTFAQGGSYELVVTGASMSPTLKPGRDMVRLVSPRGRTIHRYDLVFARRRQGGYMLHRVVKLLPGGGAVLSGDGQTWLEEVDEILALAAAIRRKGKWIPADSPGYRLYVFLWAFTRPFRGVLVKLKKFLEGGRKAHDHS